MVLTWGRTPSSRTQNSSTAQAPAEAARLERVEDQPDYVFQSGISKQPTDNKFFLMLPMPVDTFIYGFMIIIFTAALVWTLEYWGTMYF